MPLLAEDLFLLLLDERTGKPIVDGTKLPRVLAGAVLLELALAGVATPADKGESVRKGCLVLRRDAQPDDRILSRGVEIVGGGRPMKPERAIEKISKGIRDAVAARAVTDGWVREEHGRVLRVFPTVSWPQADGTRVRQLFGEIEAAVVEGVMPTSRTAAIVSLLSAVDAAPKLFPTANRRDVKARAKEIAEGEWAGKAVRKAVDAVNGAVIAGVTTATVVTGTSN